MSAVAICALAGCASNDDLGAVEQKLSDKFLLPLTNAGLEYRVEDTCRLALQPADPTWHLQASYVVDATVAQVAAVLKAEGVRLNRQRDRVQQEPSNPQGGWNGSLGSNNGTTSMVLTYDNVDVPGVAQSGGWAEACALS